MKMNICGHNFEGHPALPLGVTATTPPHSESPPTHKRLPVCCFSYELSWWSTGQCPHSIFFWAPASAAAGGYKKKKCSAQCLFFSERFAFFDGTTTLSASCTLKFKISQLFTKALVTSPVLFSTSSWSLCCFVVSSRLVRTRRWRSSCCLCVHHNTERKVCLCSCMSCTHILHDQHLFAAVIAGPYHY